ncbi:MAG: hypothetical protein KGH75_05885, partial [Rhodospirillales bacterium]|nr:hypothetical protein [Rhodospirillales bacterium]
MNDRFATTAAARIVRGQPLSNGGTLSHEYTAPLSTEELWDIVTGRVPTITYTPDWNIVLNCRAGDATRPNDVPMALDPCMDAPSIVPAGSMRR